MHDLGKYRVEFQKYIEGKPPLGSKNHSQAGAAKACPHSGGDAGIGGPIEIPTKALRGCELPMGCFCSARLCLTGKADIIEFRPGPDGAEVPFPIEYKRGRRRRWDNDDVQLCAQALCLEEMLGVGVPAGAVFHIKSKRRRDIDFSPGLRAKTEQAAHQLHELVASGRTPPPVLKPRCNGCSLIDLCMPGLLVETGRLRSYQRGLFVVSPA